MLRSVKIPALVVFLALAFVHALPAQRNKPPRHEPKRDHAITLDDHFTLAYLMEAVLSPNGDFVAYTEGRWQESTDDRTADVWLVGTKGGPPMRLTFDRASYRNLKWSPDGKRIYAAANRSSKGETGPPFDGKKQVWRLSPEGGECIAVTAVPGGIDQFDITPDGDTLYYTTSLQEVGGDWASLLKEFDGPDYGVGRGDTTQISKLNLQDWRTTKVKKLDRAVAELAVSPDGAKLALITAPEDKVVSYEGHSAAEVLDPATCALTTLPDELWRKKAPSPYGRLNSLAWSPDSRALAFVIAFDGYPSEIIVANWQDDDPVVTQLQRPPGVSLQASVDASLQVRWQKSNLCFLGTEKARIRLYCAGDLNAGKGPSYTCLTPGDVVVDFFSFDASGNLTTLIQGDPRHSQDIFLIEQQQTRQLTNVNPQIETWKIPTLSIVSWAGAGGTPIEGVLEVPADAPPGTPLPLLVSLHGGPTDSWSYRLVYSWLGSILLSSQGYALFTPNYRGSTGYGDRFLTELIGHENEIEIEDIMKGIDALVEKKIAAPDQLGVLGWSNGGYLTNCLVARTERFKAAASGAGVADVVTEWGTNDEPAFSMVFVKGFPWNKAPEYQRVSPVFTFDKVRTPTLFHVGANDQRCPAGNSRMLFRALKEYLHVDTQLIVYPKEAHGLTSYKSRKTKMAWDLAWFDRYIKGKGRPAGK